MLELPRLRRAAVDACPAEDRLDARNQLSRVEGLRHVIVGADLEPDDLVDVLVPGGRASGSARPILRMRRQTSMPSASGSIRSSTTSDGRALSELRQCLDSRRRGLDAVAGVSQVERDEGRDRLLVLDYQHRMRVSAHHPVSRMPEAVVRGGRRVAAPASTVPSAAATCCGRGRGGTAPPFREWLAVRQANFLVASSPQHHAALPYDTDVHADGVLDPDGEAPAEEAKPDVLATVGDGRSARFDPVPCFRVIFFSPQRHRGHRGFTEKYAWQIIDGWKVSRNKSESPSIQLQSTGSGFFRIPLTGLEPVLSALRGRRVNHLHHSGKIR